MSTDYVQQPTMIKELLNFVRSNPSESPYDRVEFDMVWQNLLQDIDVQWIKDTGVAWHYYAYIKNKNIKASADNFRQFVDRLLFPSSSLNDWFDPHYYNLRQWFLDQHENYHSLEYTKLFFDRELPANSMLQQIDVEQLRAYSLSNINIMRKVISLLPASRASYCQSQIQALKNRLDCMR